VTQLIQNHKQVTLSCDCFEACCCQCHRCVYWDIHYQIWYHSLSGLRGWCWELNWYLLFPPDGNNSPIIPA